MQHNSSAISHSGWQRGLLLSWIAPLGPLMSSEAAVTRLTDLDNSVSLGFGKEVSARYPPGG